MYEAREADHLSLRRLRAHLHPSRGEAGALRAVPEEAGLSQPADGAAAGAVVLMLYLALGMIVVGWTMLAVTVGWIFGGLCRGRDDVD